MLPLLQGSCDGFAATLGFPLLCDSDIKAEGMAAAVAALRVSIADCDGLLRWLVFAMVCDVLLQSLKGGLRPL